MGANVLKLSQNIAILDASKSSNAQSSLPRVPFFAWTSNRVHILTCLPDLVTTGVLMIRSSESLSVSTSLISESLWYSSTWLKSAVDASLTCGMLKSLMKLNDTSETRGLISEEAGKVLSSNWSSGNRTFAVTSGFGLAYAAGVKAPAWSVSSFHSSRFFASPDGNSLTISSLFLHPFSIAPDQMEVES